MLVLLIGDLHVPARAPDLPAKVGARQDFERICRLTIQVEEIAGARQNITNLMHGKPDRPGDIRFLKTDRA